MTNARLLRAQPVFSARAEMETGFATEFELMGAGIPEVSPLPLVLPMRFTKSIFRL